MASYEEIAELASDINDKLNTKIQPDTLVYLIETFIEEEDVPFTEVPIGEIADQVIGSILLADAFLVAQDGDDIETLRSAVTALAEDLGVGE